MELTRRDAAAALAALGAGGVLATGLDGRGDGPGDAADGDSDSPTGTGADSAATADADRIEAAMVAVAEVVYPSEVSGIEPFVTAFLAGRLDRPGHGDALAETVGKLDELAEEWYGDPIEALDPDERDRLLREVGADTAEEDPDGTLAERVRYYVVDELLLALYSSPTGGRLVGIENPQGHPGGLDSYQRGPRP